MDYSSDKLRQSSGAFLATWRAELGVRIVQDPVNARLVYRRIAQQSAQWGHGMENDTNAIILN